MSITIHSITLGNTGKIGGKTPFTVIAYSADVTGVEEIKAAAVSGNNYLTRISLQCPSMAAGEWVEIRNAADVQMYILGDMGGGLLFDQYFETPLQFSGAINIDQEAADPIVIIIEGFEA